VRQVSGDTVDAVRYRFVFEDGAWRWDGLADSSSRDVPAITRCQPRVTARALTGMLARNGAVE
jgi:hypothetical protein